jgi:hypothetical protein
MNLGQGKAQREEQESRIRIADFTSLLSDLRIRSSGDPAASDLQSKIHNLKSDFYVLASDVPPPGAGYFQR